MTSKKDYTAIAMILAKYRGHKITAGIAWDLAAYFKETNPQFDSERFFAAIANWEQAHGSTITNKV